MTTKGKYYNRTNICEYIDVYGKKCTDKLYPKNARRFEIDGKFVWYCEKHGNSYRYNLIKFITNRRSGNLHPNSNQKKGDMTEQVTAEWKKVKILNKIEDNYNLPIDHSPDKAGLIYQTKSSWLGQRYGQYNSLEGWSVKWERDYYKNFHFLILYCLDEDGERILRVYIFPKSEVERITCATIYNNKNKHWYDKYLIDEDELIRVNEIWKRLKEDKWR